jgi:hypothetical protein
MIKNILKLFLEVFMMKKLCVVLLVCVMGAAVQADLTSQPYIAGDFNGWNPGDTPMTQTAPGSGIWTYTITGVGAGTYQQFKITPGDWSVTKPAANSWYSADASGNVTVTFNTNTVSDGWLPAQFRVGVSTEPGTWSLVGDYNGWSNADPTQVMTSLGDGVYAITQTFAAGDWHLKPTQTGTWDAIGLDGRSIDAWNYNLVLASATEVTVYVNAFNGTMGIGDVDLSFLDKAYRPNPKNGDVVGTGTTSLSWTNPDPNNSEDMITCDVYFLDAGTSKLTKDPNMGPDVTDPGVFKIADDLPTPDEPNKPTLNLNDALVSVLPLQDDHYYYWAVHATDPHADPNGNPVTTQGDIWYFFTGDAAPVPSQPSDQYMYLSQDDSAIGGFGDTNPNVRYFQVTASYADDGKSPIADANMVNLNWGWDPANEQRGVEKVSQTWTPGPGTHTSGTVTAVYKTHYAEGDPDNTTALPGTWNILLEVKDGSTTATGPTGLHRIFATCGEAAAADPDDLYDGYYDTNNDCIVNLADFADFAEAWLSQSIKYE